MKAPIYCDNRLTMGDVAVRRRLTEGFEALIENYAYGPSVLAGTATAGIPHAAWLAERLELPLVYVRSMVSWAISAGSSTVFWRAPSHWSSFS